jgi:hypothetical protein
MLYSVVSWLLFYKSYGQTDALWCHSKILASGSALKRTVVGMMQEMPLND